LMRPGDDVDLTERTHRQRGLFVDSMLNLLYY
jgi:hypothetical protein